METDSLTRARQDVLYEVSRKINSQLDLPRLLDEIMDLAIELLQAEKGLVLLSNQKSPELSVQVARAMGNRTIADPVPMSRSIAERVSTDSQAVLVSKTREFDATVSLLRFEINSVLCVPLRIRDVSIGAIYLDTTNPDRCFDREDLSFLEAFANLAAIAIENAKRYKDIQELNRTLESMVAKRTAELRRRNGELEKAYQDLSDAQLQIVRSEKMASLGMLVAGIAHELNTPLGAIGSSSDLFLRSSQKLQSTFDALLKDQSEDATTEIARVLKAMADVSLANKTACDKVARIVKALRSFARLDEEELKGVDIHESLESALEMIRNQYEGRIDIIKEYGDLPLVTCRIRQLNQAFMSILVNACQAIDGQGTIWIRTESDVDLIRVTVSDTGSGIPTEDLTRVFDPGFTTKGVGTGTGLGLAIAYRIVEEHGGGIDVESVAGEGATFRVTLPRQRDL